MKTTIVQKSLKSKRKRREKLLLNVKLGLKNV